MTIRGTTAIYGIIGNPVAHSLSPLFQNRFLKQHHLDAAYLPFPVQDATDLSSVLNGLQRCGVRGLNVTVPYKEQLTDIVEHDSDASAIGAINTIRHTDHGWQGCNTDHIGMQQVILSLLDTIDRQQVLLFGAGGTARAALHACNQLGIEQLWLCNRTPERAEELVLHAKKQNYKTVVTAIAWQQQAVSTACQQAALLINTTTIGLHHQDRFPFELPPCNGVLPGAACDAVYQPDGSTSFTVAANAQGRKAIDGLPLLIAQGVASFYYWHQLSVHRQQALDDICQQLQRAPCVMNHWGNRSMRGEEP